MTTSTVGTRDFVTTTAMLDEYHLEMYVDGTYVGQIDYCPLEEDDGTLTIWRMFVMQPHRRKGYCVEMLERLRQDVPDARTLELDMGTRSANQVVAKWLDAPVNDAGVYVF